MISISTLQIHRPDLAWIDPLLAFIGGDVSKQEVTGQFLRTWLQPAISRANCGLVVVHHPPKPKREIGESNHGDDAYFGAGSSDLANYSRAVIVVKPTEHVGIYLLRLAKRGKRAGWTTPAGAAKFDTTIAHGLGGLIYWRIPTEDELAKIHVEQHGPGSADLLALVIPGSEIEKNALISKAKKLKIGQNHARGLIAELLDSKELIETRVKQPNSRPKSILLRPKISPQNTPPKDDENEW